MAAFSLVSFGTVAQLLAVSSLARLPFSVGSSVCLSKDCNDVPNFSLLQSGFETLRTRNMSAVSHVGLESSTNRNIPPSPNGASLEIPVFTAITSETKQHPMPGSPGRNFLNVAAGKPWKRKDWLARVGFYREALLTVPADRLVILADGLDVAFGGCSHQELVRRYEHIVNMSIGGAVVFGSQLRLFPTDSTSEFQLYDNLYSRLDGKRQELLRSNNLNNTPYAAYVDEADCRRNGDGSSLNEYKFLNAGFAMGPASKLAEIYSLLIRSADSDETLRHIRDPISGKETDKWDDQKALHWLLLRQNGTQLISLDYAGTLVVNLIRMKADPIERLGDGTFRNKASGEVPCFIHGNGGDKTLWNSLVKDM